MINALSRTRLDIKSRIAEVSYSKTILIKERLYKLILLKRMTSLELSKMNLYIVILESSNLLNNPE